jgi:dCTP deaminase
VAVLARKALLRRIYGEADWNKKLVVTPLLDPSRQVPTGSAALDTRLGTSFLGTKRAEISHLDPLSRLIAAEVQKAQEPIYVPIGRDLTLHPRQFLLGMTLEYYRFPPDLCGYVVGRSSWGRLGLVIATATFVQPGFAGCLTLELTNLGETPITLYPGWPIAQLVVETVDNPEIRAHLSKYHMSTSPEYSRVYAEPVAGVLKRIQRRTRTPPRRAP